MSSAKHKKILIITSSCGGGHLQLAIAKEQEIKDLDPTSLVFTRDVMKDWIWKPIGWLFIQVWNQSQRSGILWIQSICCAAPRLFNILIWPCFFIYSLRTVFRENVDRVIDTQCFGTSATIKAIRIFNKMRKKNVYLEKVFSDLPTKEANHFFWPIRHLSENDRGFFKLIAIAPLLEKGQSPENFWKTHCNLPLSKLEYQYFYVRKPFKKFLHKEREKEDGILQVTYKSQEELDLILQSMQRGSALYSIQDGRIEIRTDPNHRVYTILLGSQPANDATLNYIKAFIQIAQENPNVPTCLFVYCAEYTPAKETLFSRSVEFIKQVENYPPSLTIIPMTFQGEEIIASLFFRSDMTCTKSGGQTAMELMCVGRGKIWIHSETKAKGRTLLDEDLIKGIPGWEAGNAVYLQQFRDAKLVTPEMVPLLAKDL